jgi:hypothetical protein
MSTFILARRLREHVEPKDCDDVRSRRSMPMFVHADQFGENEVIDAPGDMLFGESLAVVWHIMFR